jgi:hypothetical protein
MLRRVIQLEKKMANMEEEARERARELARLHIFRLLSVSRIDSFSSVLVLFLLPQRLVSATTDNVVQFFQ